MDACNMKAYKKEFFDVAFDKATLDTLMVIIS